MRVPRLVSDFFDWRWSPCVGLTAGSLAFVALALLFIPTHVGGEPREVSTLSAFDSPRTQRAIYSSALTPSVSETEARRAEDSRFARTAPPSGPQRNEMRAPQQRGFSPILERPEPPPAAPAPAPAPAPSPAEPPAPAPGSVIVTQPEPGGPSRESTVQ